MALRDLTGGNKQTEQRPRDRTSGLRDEPEAGALRPGLGAASWWEGRSGGGGGGGWGPWEWGQGVGFHFERQEEPEGVYSGTVTVTAEVRVGQAHS